MNRLTIERTSPDVLHEHRSLSSSRGPDVNGPDDNRSAGRKRIWRLERRLIERVLRHSGQPAVSIELWSGEQFGTVQSPTAELFVRDRRTFWKLIFDPQFQFGEAYAAGGLEIKGDLITLMCELLGALDRGPRPSAWSRAAAAILHRPRRTTRSASRKNVYHHYDIGNDFYRLWLDEQLAYTCAYFDRPDCTLEEAQIAKMDHVCRKLRLRPGDTVIEAGCGWGALALRMASRYGAKVRAFNISHEQIDYARQRAKTKGLADRVEFIEDDWRNIDGKCDAFVSVGMLEHVGLANYRRLGEVIHRALTPHGRGLIHTIGRNRSLPMDPWIERRIFPGSRPPTLGEINTIFEPYGFSVLDVENLRLHYAETLTHWLARFEASVDKIAEMFDERFVRIWRLYLASSAAAFVVGNMQLFQVVFAPSKNNDTPRTRAHLYHEDQQSLPADGEFFQDFSAASGQPPAPRQDRNAEN